MTNKTIHEENTITLKKKRFVTRTHTHTLKKHEKMLVQHIQKGFFKKQYFPKSFESVIKTQKHDKMEKSII